MVRLKQNSHTSAVWLGISVDSFRQTNIRTYVQISYRIVLLLPHRIFRWPLAVSSLFIGQYDRDNKVVCLCLDYLSLTLELVKPPLVSQNIQLVRENPNPEPKAKQDNALLCQQGNQNKKFEKCRSESHRVCQEIP